MSKLRSLSKDYKIDWSNAVYLIDAGTKLNYKFELNPDDFLRFAKQDISRGTTHGLINGLTNAKRCIDCEVDKFIYATKIAQNWEGYISRIESYIAGSEEDIFSDAPIKLRLLHALGVAPSLLVSRYRTIRNKLEHEYKIPTTQEVKEAIDLAQLFRGCVDNALNIIFAFFISPQSSKAINKIEDRPTLDIRYRNGEFIIDAYHPNRRKKREIIFPNDVEYLPLLRISIVLESDKNVGPAHYDLMRSIGISVPTGAHEPNVDYCSSYLSL
jgi:hypothetical protein